MNKRKAERKVSENDWRRRRLQIDRKRDMKRILKDLEKGNDVQVVL